MAELFSPYKERFGRFSGRVSARLLWFLFCFQRVIHRIVAPTTCICSPNARRSGLRMFPECSWKTPLIHTTLWKTNDLRTQGASRSGEALEVQTGPPKPLTGR